MDLMESFASGFGRQSLRIAYSLALWWGFRQRIFLYFGIIFRPLRRWPRV